MKLYDERCQHLEHLSDLVNKYFQNALCCKTVQWFLKCVHKTDDNPDVALDTCNSRIAELSQENLERERPALCV